MARAYRGPYARQSSYNPGYATAAVWGTGIDPIHSYYGEGPPLRVMGRGQASGSSPVANLAPADIARQTPAYSSSQNPPQDLLWGYPPDMGQVGPQYSPDSFGAGADAPIDVGDVAPGEEFFMDDHPHWDTPHDQQRVRGATQGQPSWNQSGFIFRAIRGGAQRYRMYRDSYSWPGFVDQYAPVTAEQPNSLPTETVNEGWLNKVTSTVAYAKPSDESQYEVQTSMRQRFGVRVNDRAVDRCTDDARSTIESRVEPMIAKVFSEGERNYDMFPFQIDQIERPFRFRTAGVGRSDWMESNEINSLTPVQRTPPPDPAAGYPEVYADYGYQEEDGMYFSG